jgi:hypothetical protein
MLVVARASFIAFAVIFVLQPLLASAELVFIEPDDFERGTVISDVVPGVELSVSGRSAAGPEVQVVQLGLGRASTGELAFGYFYADGSTGFGWRDDSVTQAFFHTDFVVPASFFAIDIVRGGGPGDTADSAILWAFDIDGNLLETVQTLGGQQEFETLLVTRPTADIYSIQVTGARHPVILDNLRFEIAGELPPPSCEVRLQVCETDLTRVADECGGGGESLEACQEELALERMQGSELQGELAAAWVVITELERELERQRHRDPRLGWLRRFFRKH